MPLLLLLVLVGGAVLEIWVALRLGDLIGVAPVVLLLIASTLLGSRVLGRGTVRSWRRVAEASRDGDSVGRSVLDAGLVVVSGVLLVLPGLVSGALGLLLLAPPVRAVVRPVLALLVARRVTLPVVLGARGAEWATGRARGTRPGVPSDVEGHATERSGPARSAPDIVVLPPAEDDPRRPGA